MSSLSGALAALALALVSVLTVSVDCEPWGAIGNVRQCKTLDEVENRVNSSQRQYVEVEHAVDDIRELDLFDQYYERIIRMLPYKVESMFPISGCFNYRQLFKAQLVIRAGEPPHCHLRRRFIHVELDLEKPNGERMMVFRPNALQYDAL